MATHFDTLAMVEALEGTGLSQARREVLARAIHDVAMQQTASKTEVDRAIDRAVHSLTVRIGAMIGAAVTILIAAAAVLVTLQ